MSQLFTEFERLLGHYCQTRDGDTYIRLVRDVMPALTMSQEEDECARRYRALAPGELTPFKEPRNLRYEEWKRTHCWRWYYFDHERDAKETLRQRLERDPECAVSRVPTMESTFRMGVEQPEGVRPTTMRWQGYAPPPLLGVGEDQPGLVLAQVAYVAMIYAMMGSAVGAVVGVASDVGLARGAGRGALAGVFLGAAVAVVGKATA